jgi:NTP pyrophosphatase (non-canonical NTP hydrolase)
MHLAELQDLMERTYGTRDRERGLPAAVAWLAEEVGELAQALRKGSIQDQRDEFADVLAWLATLANIADVDLDAALERFAAGCPKCGGIPCHCGRIDR